jgi:hypothetical protein
MINFDAVAANGELGATKSPWAFVCTVRAMPVSMLVTMTFAPGTTAPLESEFGAQNRPAEGLRIQGYCGEDEPKEKKDR